MPSLDAAPGSVPSLGSRLSLEITNLPPEMGVLALGFGFDLGQIAGLPLPLDLGWIGLRGCDLWVGLEPSLTLLVGHLGLGKELAFPIPSDPTLAGQRFAMQAIVFDNRAANGCASMSNAAIATLH